MLMSSSRALGVFWTLKEASVFWAKVESQELVYLFIRARTLQEQVLMKMFAKPVDLTWSHHSARRRRLACLCRQSSLSEETTQRPLALASSHLLSSEQLLLGYQVGRPKLSSSLCPDPARPFLPQSMMQPRTEKLKGYSCKRLELFQSSSQISHSNRQN